MEEIKVNLENLTEEERKNLLSLIEKANKPKSKMWEPEIGMEYWYIGSDGIVYKIVQTDSTNDQNKKAIGNRFATQDEAVEAKQSLMYKTMLKRLSIESGEDENPWDGNHNHYYLSYDCNKKFVTVEWVKSFRDESTTFASEESALKALATIGEENFKRYILGIKE